jgi:hypothetical protein
MDIWHLLANKWNDKDFAPEIMSLPQLHTKFALQDIMLHSEVAALTPATADKVEDKWASMIKGREELTLLIMQKIKCVVVLPIALSMHLQVINHFSVTGNSISFIGGKCLIGMTYLGLLCKS